MLCWKSSLDPLPLFALEPQRHTYKQLEVFPSSLVNTADADGIVVLDARHEMLLGRMPGGGAVWIASSPDSRHHYLLLKPQQVTSR